MPGDLPAKPVIDIIDDDPAMTEWFKVLLEHAGYELRTALIGTRGEELFKTWHPDAAITDSSMLNSIKVRIAPMPADGRPEMIVIGWMKLS